MIVDPTTTYLAAVVVAAALAVHVSLTTALRRPEPSTFAWSAGFLALASAAGIAAATESSSGRPTAATCAVLGALVLAVGLLWLGVHRFDAREGPLASWVGASGVAAAMAAWLLDPAAALAVAAVLVAASSAGCVRTLTSRPAGGNVDTRLGVAACVGLAVAAAAIGVAALTVDDGTSTLLATLVLATCGPFAAMAALSLYGLQALRSASMAAAGGSPDETALSVLDRTTFWRVASHRVERARAQGGTALSLVVAGVADLDQIRTVYGSQAARGTVSHVAAVIARQVPVSSEIGHLGGGRFAVLSIVVPGRSSDAVIEAIGTGLFAGAVSDRLPVRATCTFQAADTGSPDDFAELLDQVAPPSEHGEWPGGRPCRRARSRSRADLGRS